MRQGTALFLGVWAALTAGCVTAQPVRAPAAWVQRLRPFQAAPRPDLVIMEVVLLERPVGDPYINQELWGLADEQVVPLECKALLEDNGLRVGQLGGIPPARLQTLLTSEKSCANPRRLQLRAGSERTLSMGPVITRCTFDLRQEGDPETVELHQAECDLTVVPTPLEDGRVRLHFTPQIRHGTSALVFKPAPDQAGGIEWALREQQPREDYAALGWDVTLGASAYIIIGARFDRPGTLGHRTFVRPEESVPVQRLLVLRACSAGAGKGLDEGPADGEEKGTLPGPTPLAAQAAWSAHER